MSEPKRQHPVAAITQVLQIIKQNFLTIIFILFLGSGNGNTFFQFFGLVPVMLFVLIAGALGWWRFTYQIVDGDLHIERGVVVRKKLYLSPERIQVIDINAGLIQRIFGLVSVEVKTAGSSTKDAKISAVTVSEAERIKSLLPKREKTGEQEEEAENTTQIYKLKTKDLFTAAATSGNITLTLALVGGALSQAEQFMTEEQFVGFIEYVTPTSFDMNIALSFVILVIIVSLLLSFAGTFVKYYGFTLTVSSDELHVETGLLTQKQSTVPFDRIQGIQIKEKLLREPFGLSAIIIESAGYGERQQNATTLFPLIHKKEVSNFLGEVLPKYKVDVQENVQPPSRSIRRYILRPVWVALAVVIPLCIWVPYGFYSLLLFIPAALLGYIQYRDAQIGTTDDTLVIERRTLSRTKAIIKRERIMAAGHQQNPFQNRLNLYNLNITIASGSKGRTFTIKELDEDEEYNFLRWASPAVKPCSEEIE